ncbi:hypothetical protein D9M72_524640 [compost metagenome]
MRPDLDGAAIDHVERDIEDDGEADIGDPVITVEQPGDETGRHAHHRNRKRKADNQDRRMFAGGACDGQHVVERHRDVGDDDLDGRLHEGLLGRVAASAAFACRVSCLLLADFAPHLPADPQQQNTAGEQEADDFQELDRDAGERDAQHSCRDDADEDDLLALLRRQPGGGKADDDGVVAGKNQIDDDDLQKRCQTGGGKDFHDATVPRRAMMRDSNMSNG